MRRTLLSPQRREGAKNRGYPAPGIPAIQTVTLQRQRRPVSPRRHRVHGDFTEASGFSVHLRVLCVSVVTKVLEFFLSLAFHNTPGDHSESEHRSRRAGRLVKVALYFLQPLQIQLPK